MTPVTPRLNLIRSKLDDEATHFSAERPSRKLVSPSVAVSRPIKQHARFGPELVNVFRWQGKARDGFEKRQNIGLFHADAAANTSALTSMPWRR